MERVFERTSGHFAGMISMMKPMESWVGSWNHLEARNPGVYAVDVDGELEPDEVEEEDDMEEEII
jgi:hypothetical protein